MAREATARLYDVDQDSVVLKNLTRSGRYDRGTITFRAKKGKFVELDKLHESVWATRLSGGTSSGLVTLEITAIGELQKNGNEVILNFANQEPVTPDRYFILSKHPDAEHSKTFDELMAVQQRGEQIANVTGIVEGWSGVWPKVLRELPPKPRRVLVTHFETTKENGSNESRSKDP